MSLSLQPSAMVHFWITIEGDLREAEASTSRQNVALRFQEGINNRMKKGTCFRNGHECATIRDMQLSESLKQLRLQPYSTKICIWYASKPGYPIPHYSTSNEVTSWMFLPPNVPTRSRDSSGVTVPACCACPVQGNTTGEKTHQWNFMATDGVDEDEKKWPTKTPNWSQARPAKCVFESLTRLSVSAIKLQFMYVPGCLMFNMNGRWD